MRKKSKFGLVGVGDEFYRTEKWLLAAARAYARDKRTCQICKKTIFGMHNVDHIIPINEDSPDELKYGQENLQTLCVSCHNVKRKDDALNFARHREKVIEVIIDKVLEGR